MIPTFEFCKYLKIDIIVSNLILPESTKLAGIISFALSIGISFQAIAQLPTPTIQTIKTQINPSKNSPVVAKLLFVNPNIGNDKTGDGSEQNPWKSLTQALQLAPVNSVITLSPGTYSSQTGEIFPLFLKPGVSIQGNMENQGRDVKILGGGEYLSRSFGGENVAIVGANQSSLSGVTISNTNNRGYGLWIESTNTLVQNNTFISNTQDGIAISGNATPSINKNYFYQNGANGVTISGTARPEVRENLFVQTGFAINIIDNAAPVIVANRIQQNRSGIVLQANSHPVLRNNLIEYNQEDGLVIVSQAIPDLGNATDPARNEFRQNARYDINAKAAKQIISVAGNYLDINHITSNIDISGMTAPLSSNSGSESPLSPVNQLEVPPGFNYVKVKPSVQSETQSGVVEFDAPQPSP